MCVLEPFQLNNENYVWSALEKFLQIFILSKKKCWLTESFLRVKAFSKIEIFWRCWKYIVHVHPKNKQQIDEKNMFKSLWSLSFPMKQWKSIFRKNVKMYEHIFLIASIDNTFRFLLNIKQIEKKVYYSSLKKYP